MSSIGQALQERDANRAFLFSDLTENEGTSDESCDESEKQQATPMKSKNIPQICLPSVNFLIVMFPFIWFGMTTRNFIPHVEEDLVGGMRAVSNDATFFSAFVDSHLSLEEKNTTIGKIVTSDGDEIATYTKVSENIVNCNVNERLLTPNDFNKFANVFCDAVAQEMKIIIHMH